MKSLLFTLGLALCCVVQANQDERFEEMDRSKVNGDHYVVAMATTCQKMKEMLPKMPVSPVSFFEQSPDEVRMTMEIATPQGCKTIKPVIRKENGRFVSKCGKGGKKTVEMVNVNEDFMSSLITLSHPQGECKIATLASRSVDVSEEAKKEFTDFVVRNGLGGEKIHSLRREGMCQRSS